QRRREVPAMSMRRRKPSPGYTMIEVMTALALLTVGATGVVAMQKAAVVGNSSARSIATANAIAARWAERLRVDSMVWNANTAPDHAQTRWIKAVTATPNTWLVPPAVAGKVAPYADPLGADIIDNSDTSPVAYCTHISYRQLRPKMVATIVRVTWRRDS